MGLLPIVLNCLKLSQIAQIVLNCLKLSEIVWKKATPTMGPLPIVLNCLQLSQIVSNCPELS